jgi:hypothetical protein
VALLREAVAVEQAAAELFHEAVAPRHEAAAVQAEALKTRRRLVRPPL